MGKVNWTKRSSDPEAMLCVGERIAYSSANTGLAATYCLLMAFISYYYTNIIGIPAATLGTIFLISRVFDGVTDIMMGWVVDRTHTKMGKTRPWILIMAIPHALACILAFAVPMEWTGMKQYIYVFVTYNLVNAVTYTMSSVPIYAANCVLTNNSEEHTKSGIWMQVGGNGMLLFIQYTCLSLVGKLGNDARAWTYAAVLYSALGAVLMIFGALCTRERVITTVEETKIPLKQRLHAIFSNKYWVLYTLTWLVAAIIFFLIDAGCVYYTDAILHNTDAYSTMATIQTFVMVISLVVFMGWIINKLGLVKTTVLSYLLMGGGSLIQFFTMNWTVLIVCNMLKGLGMACHVGTQGALMADACNYGSEKVGFDTSGIGNAGISFGSKLGYGLAGVLMGWTLDFFKYDGTAAVYSQSALTGVNVIYLVYPIVFCIIGILLMVPYDLYRKEKNEK